MSSDRYTGYLDYFPEKERKAAEEVLYIEDSPDNLAMPILKHINRSSKTCRKPLRNVYERF